MKNKILLILFVIQIIGLKNIFSQPYIPMVKDSLFWNITNVNFALNPWEQDSYSTIKLGMIGDTLINNVSYKKIYGVSCFSDSILTNSNSYYGAMREDSTKKVYFIKDSIEYLEYDFSLNVGDTFNYVSNWFQNIQLVVNSIDSIEIDGQFRKRINIFPESYMGWTHPWIEGIGSTASLTDYCYPWGNFDVHLSCFFENINLIYGSSEYCCLGAINQIEQNSSIEKIKIYPNPVKDFIKIDFNSNTEKIIEIRNIQNNISEIINCNKKHVQIDFSLFPKGIYFFKIITGYKIMIEKVVKI